VKNRVHKNLLVFAGVVEILVGALHFFMMSSINKSSGFSQLSPIESDFVALVVFCVGILLICFGTMTLYFARENLSKILYYYLAAKSLLWGGRVVLELMYPIGLEMFMITPFTSIVLPGVMVEFLIFFYLFLSVRGRMHLQNLS